MTVSPRPTITSPALIPPVAAGPPGLNVVDHYTIGLGQTKRSFDGLIDARGPDPKVPSGNTTILSKLVHNGFRGANRDREADVVGIRRAQRIHANDRAAEIDQRPPGVARIDGRVSLNEPVEVGAGGALLGWLLHFTRQSTYNSSRNRWTPGQTQGVADRDDPLTNFEIFGISERDSWKALAVDLHDGQVSLEVGAEQARVKLPIVWGWKNYPQADGAVNHVVVGDDIAGVIENEPSAEPARD